MLNARSVQQDFNGGNEMNEKPFNPIPLTTMIPGMAAEPFNQDDLLRTSYRPTLVIGLGGTGLSVVRRLKKLIRSYYHGRDLDIFQFMVFDTAPQEMVAGEEPLDAGEFVHLEAFDAADLVRHLNENPYIARWWPGGSERPYRPTFSGTGANRVRAVGRLVLHSYLSSVVIPRIETKLDRAISINAQPGLGANSLKVYIISSLAGGTGSGMVTDIAYITRMLGLRRQPTTYLTGLLVLDDAFAPKAHTENTRAEFRANTYQALRELNHFSRVRRFKEVYDDITSTAELPDGFRPFDIAYLLGLHNADGKALSSFEDLANMMAAEIMTEIASPLQGRTENVLDNVRANDRAIAGQPAAFSSFVLASLAFPLKGASSWFALAAYEPFVRQALLTTRSQPSGIGSDVLAFMQTARIEQERTSLLREQLDQDAQGSALVHPELSYDQINGLSDAQLLGSLQHLEESALADLERNRSALGERTLPVQKNFTRTLEAECNAILRSPQRGLQYLAWFLSQLVERLRQQRDQAASEQTRLRAEVDLQSAAWRAASAEIGQILRLPSWLPLRNHQLRSAQSAYASAFNAYLDDALQLELVTQAMICSADFEKEAKRIALRVADLISNWQGLAAKCAEMAGARSTQQRATETEFALMHHIVSNDDLGRMLKKNLPDLGDESTCAHLAGLYWSYFERAVPGWSIAADAGSPQATPEMQLYDFLAEWFGRNLKNRTLIEMLQEIHGSSWPREVELRYRQAAPFWSYNLSRFGDRIRNNLQHEPRLVGYGEENTAAWAGQVARATGENIDGVNNKNPQEMVFLKTSHGLPLFALRSIEQVMRNSYLYLHQLWQDDCAGGNPIPVFISTDWETEMGDSDLQPLPESESARPGRLSMAPISSNGHKPVPEHGAPGGDGALS